MAEKDKTTSQAEDPKPDVIIEPAQAETHVAETPAAAGDFREYFNRHRTLFTWVFGGLIVVILGFIAYNQLYLQPLEKDGQVAIFKAQRLFEDDSLRMALNGVPRKNITGMTEVADNYGGSKAGKLAHYYIGMALLRQGKYEDAIDELKQFKAGDKIIMPLALGGIGDAYVQLKNYDDAVDYYMKAAKDDDNEFTAPHFYKKAGLVYEKIGEYKKAKDVYQTIKDKYKTSHEGTDIDKYIARAGEKEGGK